MLYNHCFIRIYQDLIRVIGQVKNEETTFIQKIEIILHHFNKYILLGQFLLCKILLSMPSSSKTNDDYMFRLYMQERSWRGKAI